MPLAAPTRPLDVETSHITRTLEHRPNRDALIAVHRATVLRRQATVGERTTPQSAETYEIDQQAAHALLGAGLVRIMPGPRRVVIEPTPLGAARGALEHDALSCTEGDVVNFGRRAWRATCGCAWQSDLIEGTYSDGCEALADHHDRTGFDPVVAGLTKDLFK